MNNSPWIAQLHRTRSVEPITGDFETDIAVIGGGIAGVSTAFFLLTQTDKKVILLEGDKIAHGATGHNAGQVSSDFEITFKEMSERFGLTASVDAYHAIEVVARDLLKEMLRTANIDIPFSECVGYFAKQFLQQVLDDLEDMYLKHAAGVNTGNSYILDTWYETVSIPERYDGLYTLVTREQLNTVLETDDDSYIAADTFLSGVMNSALFTESVYQYLLQTYPGRLIASEGAFVSAITLENDTVTICYNTHCIKASQVVLCTNGFESIKITNDREEGIDTSFHEEVYGIVGYMAAYVKDENKAPVVLAYGLNRTTEDNPYYYVTRRQIEIEKELPANLISFGGPQVFLPDRAVYDKAAPYPEAVVDDMDTFASRTYGRHADEMNYHWHGLMGYTKNQVRLIGPDMHDPKLLYNLGCNGIGILTSIYGGRQIARFVNSEQVAPSIFDPKL